MSKQKDGTNVYKALCAVVFVIFSFVYLYYYQTDILAAAQHVASGGKTHYEPILGTILIILGLKLLQYGIQAIVRLKRIFFVLTYFPSFLILTLITDIPSAHDEQINFGAWAWALPLALVAWAFLVYLARQYQPVEVETRGGGVFSQVVGVNVTLMLVMMLMTCLIGNHNRLFHQRMHVEFLISRKEYREAQVYADKLNSSDANISLLRAYSLALQHHIGDNLFKSSMSGINSIIPLNNETYTVILPGNELMQYYKRDADWQLSEMLVKGNLNEFYDNLVFFYNLGNGVAPNDSTANKADVSKEVKKQNSYKDSILSVRYQNLPRHYQEALVLYNYLVTAQKQKRPLVKPSYLNNNLVEQFNKFQHLPVGEQRKQFAGTYWAFYESKSR